MRSPTTPVVGVLAVQGAFAEHRDALARVGAHSREVRTPEQLAQVDALVIPGGESTTLRRVAGDGPLLDALRARRGDGLPMLGTCAGLIALADAIEDGDDVLIGGLDVTVRRNGYGRQVASFEGEVTYADGATAVGVFIRAPLITRVGDGVEVTARRREQPVAVRCGDVAATAFHPELAGDDRLHTWISDRARAYHHHTRNT